MRKYFQKMKKAAMLGLALSMAVVVAEPVMVKAAAPTPTYYINDSFEDTSGGNNMSFTTTVTPTPETPPYMLTSIPSQVGEEESNVLKIHIDNPNPPDKWDDNCEVKNERKTNVYSIPIHDQKTRFEIKFQTNILGDKNGFFALGGGTWSGALVSVANGKYSVSSNYSDKEIPDAPAFVTNQWTHLFVVLDGTANTYDVYSNGQLLQKDVAYGGGGSLADGLRSVTFTTKTWSGSDNLYEDLRVAKFDGMYLEDQNIAADETEVSVGTNVVLDFTSLIDSESLENISVVKENGEEVAGQSVAIDSVDKSKCIITFAEPLETNVKYQVKTAGVADVYGTACEQEGFFFTTGEKPMLAVTNKAMTKKEGIITQATFVDDFGADDAAEADCSKIYKRVAGEEPGFLSQLLSITNEKPEEYIDENGDPDTWKLQQTPAGAGAYVVYQLPGDIDSFDIQVFRRTDRDPSTVKYYTASYFNDADNSADWTEITVNQSTPTVVQSGFPRVQETSKIPIPEGHRYFKLEYVDNITNWNPRIGKISIVYDVTSTDDFSQLSAGTYTPSCVVENAWNETKTVTAVLAVYSGSLLEDVEIQKDVAIAPGENTIQMTEITLEENQTVKLMVRDSLSGMNPVPEVL